MPEVLRETTPKARKEHKCSSCFGAILPGVTYTRSACLYDGRVYDWLTCIGCADIRGDVFAWALDWEEGVTSADYEEWAREHVDHPVQGQGARAYLARRYPNHKPTGRESG